MKLARPLFLLALVAALVPAGLLALLTSWAGAAPHRAPAFRACEAVLERLKQEVPIWKREVYEDGTEWVGLGP